MWLVDGRDVVMVVDLICVDDGVRRGWKKVGKVGKPSLLIPITAMDTSKSSCLQVTISV